MAGQMGWLQVHVTCPFFQGYTRNTIRCEGFMDGSHTTTSFDQICDRTQHLKVFCCEKNDFCEVYRMIREAKYPEDA